MSEIVTGEIEVSSDAYVIEVRGQTAGIVARDGQGFRFYAASHQFNHLEGEAFPSPRDAERAALAAGRARPRAYAGLRG